MYTCCFRMYLFEDGLVRMCTEEYVKPTKQVKYSQVGYNYSQNEIRHYVQ